MSTVVLAFDWSNTANIGYPVLGGGVLLGSIIPIVPTGAVVGAAAAVAMTTDHLSLPIVLVLSTVAAFAGDVVTFGIARLGGPAAVRWVARGQREEQLEKARDRFTRRGWQIVVIGRLVPAGRIPVLLAAGALAYPWRRLVPASLVACFVWAVAYALLGVVSGGIFDSPLVATVLATVLVLLVTVLMNVISRKRKKAGDRS